MAQNQRYENFKAHFSNEISEGLKEFVINEALIWSRYLFVKRVTSTIQRGFCTYCQAYHMISSSKTLKHNESWQCEKCKSLVLVKSAGRGRGKMFDKAYVVWYEKSQTDPKAIIATGYNVSIDYRDDFKGVTEFYPVARYVFEQGKSTMMYRNNYYSGCFNKRVIHYEEGWSFTKEPFTVIGKNSFTYHSFQSIESIQAAVKDTPFIYCPWERFKKRNQDLIYCFSTYSKYPFIEYLIKMGMGKIAECMVEGGNMYRTINYRGKTMEKILGLTKKEIKEWKASSVIMDPLVLHTYKWFKREDTPISWEVAKQCEHLVTGDFYLKNIDFIRNFVPLERIMKYVLKQMKKSSKRFYSITGTISDWKDYLEECTELGMNLKSEKVIMPNNLHEAHQKTTRAIKVKNDETLNKQIAALQPQLKKYWFEYGDLNIRPAVSSIEMFDEGKALDHCVGRYADRYAKGEIAIMFVRLKSDPEKSFYTLELNRKTNEIVQCRRLKNCDTTPEVKAFLNEFIKAKLTKKPKSRKIKKTEREAVAV